MEDKGKQLTSRVTKKCLSIGCRKCAQGSTDFCIAHGGGRRCTFPGCTKGARDRHYCAGHGGGKRCANDTCSKAAVGGSSFCTSHGGGKKCAAEDCQKSAQSPTLFCVRHGGGKTCAMDSCKKVARGKSKFCAGHGGGQPCRVLNCPTAAISNNLYCKSHRSILKGETAGKSSNAKAASACLTSYAATFPLLSTECSAPAVAPVSLPSASTLLCRSSLPPVLPQSNGIPTYPSPTQSVDHAPTLCMVCTTTTSDVQSPPNLVAAIEKKIDGDARKTSTPLLFQDDEIDAALILHSMGSQGTRGVPDTLAIQPQGDVFRHSYLRLHAWPENSDKGATATAPFDVSNQSHGIVGEEQKLTCVPDPPSEIALAQLMVGLRAQDACKAFLRPSPVVSTTCTASSIRSKKRHLQYIDGYIRKPASPVTTDEECDYSGSDASDEGLQQCRGLISVKKTRVQYPQDSMNSSLSTQ